MDNKELIQGLNKISWQYLVNRKTESILFGSLVDKCSDFYEEVTGLKWRSTNIVRLVTSGEYLLDREEIIQLKISIKKGGLTLFKSVRDRLVKNISQHKKRFSRFNKTDFSKYSKQDLFKVYSEFVDSSLRSHCFMARQFMHVF